MKTNLSIREAAAYLGVSPITLRRWEKQGRLSPRRTKGNQRRYALSELRFLKSLSKKNNSQSAPESNEALLRTLLSKMESVESRLPATASGGAAALPHSHSAFAGILVSLLLLILLTSGAITAYFLTPASFKSSLLNPLASFLLSGGARVEGTMRFLSTIFFGETDQWFITPTGDASFRNLNASSITAHSGSFSSLTVDRLEAGTLEGAVSWENVTEKPVILSSLDNVSNNEGNIDLIAAGNITITPNDSTNTITFTVPATAQG